MKILKALTLILPSVLVMLLTLPADAQEADDREQRYATQDRSPPLHTGRGITDTDGDPEESRAWLEKTRKDFQEQSKERREKRAAEGNPIIPPTFDRYCVPPIDPDQEVKYCTPEDYQRTRDLMRAMAEERAAAKGRPVDPNRPTQSPGTVPSGGQKEDSCPSGEVEGTVCAFGTSNDHADSEVVTPDTNNSPR